MITDQKPVFFGHGHMTSVDRIRELVDGVRERSGYPTNSPTASLEYSKRGQFMVEAIEWLLAQVRQQ